MLPDLLFAAPGRLVLAAAVGLLAVAVLVRPLLARRGEAFASPALRASVLTGRPGWQRAATAGLLLAGLLTASVGFARPQVVAEQARERSIVVVLLDTSTSMLAEDVLPDRFSAALEAATVFVRGLPEQVDVGLVAYDARVRLVAAPTADHELVVAALQELDLSGGTALGDAVTTGLAALPAAFRAGRTDDGMPPAARMVVLSDGGSTTGRDVPEAAAQAAADGVPVSTIAYGTDAGIVVQDGRTFPVPVEEGVLRELAEVSGGTAYDASDAGQLQQVYADIGATLTRETARRELTAPFTGVALVLLLVGAAVGLRAGGRLL